MVHRPIYEQGNQFKCRACGAFTIDEALPAVTYEGLSYTDFAPHQCSNKRCEHNRPEYPKGWYEEAP